MSHNAEITPRHPDRSLCGHQLTGSTAAEQGCPGQADHLVTCACGWARTDRNPRRLLTLHRTHSARRTQGGAG